LSPFDPLCSEELVASLLDAAVEEVLAEVVEAALLVVELDASPASAGIQTLQWYDMHTAPGHLHWLFARVADSPLP
jgi:hypothetical protein